MKRSLTMKITYCALCLALAYVLPLLTGQIREIGSALCPMHIPVLLCGFICGGPWGLIVGFIAPLTRSLLFGRPAFFPDAVSMAFELAAYGALSGLFYQLLPKRTGCLYLALILAMLGGRLVWGASRFVIAGLTASEFPFSAFLAGAVLNCIPGLILHILLVPVVVIALEKAKLLPVNKSA